MSVQIPGHAEAVRLVTDRRVVEVPRDRQDVLAARAEGAATQHPPHAAAGFPRRAVGWRALIVRYPAILHPLRNTAEHAVEAEAVGLEAVHRHRAALVLGAAALRAVRLRDAELVAPPVTCLGAGAGAVFPLRLARQAVAAAGDARQPGDVLLRVVPGNIVQRRR